MILSFNEFLLEEASPRFAVGDFVEKEVFGNSIRGRVKQVNQSATSFDYYVTWIRNGKLHSTWVKNGVGLIGGADQAKAPEKKEIEKKTSFKIPSTVINRELKHAQKRLKEIAKENKLDPDKFLKYIDSSVKEWISEKNVDVCISISAVNLKKVLNDGRFKTQFEINPEWVSEPEGREETEKTLFGYDSSFDPKKRPVYGFLKSKNKSIPTAVHDYMLQDGTSTGITNSKIARSFVVLKNDVRDRTTFAMSDTMGSLLKQHDRERASSLNDPIPILSAPLSKMAKMPKDLYSAQVLYTEVQVHNSVSLNDIDKIIFNREPDDDTKDKLASKKIKYEVDAKAFKNG